VPGMSTVPRLAAVGVVAATIGVFAGCGGGSDSGGGEAGTTTAASSSPAGFGQAAGAADRAAAGKTVESFVSAWLDQDAAKACSLMADSTKRNLAVFSSQLKGGDCAGEASSVRAAMSAEMLSHLRGAQVTGVRVSGGRGFVLYRAGGHSWALPVVRQGSAWKVGAIAGYQVG
jgi:hypothetical protein